MTEQNLPATTGDSRLSLGQTHLDASDLILPRIKVVQQMAAEANDERAKPGEFFDTLRGRSLGTELRFLALLPFKQRVFLVRDEKRATASVKLEAAGLPPLTEGDGLKCRSLDMYQGIGEPGIACNDCPLSKWDGNIPPPCSETYNVAAMSELGELMILSFVKSSAKTGKRLFSMIRMAGADALPWTRIYQATTRKEKNDKGIFFVPDVVDTGEAPPTELLRSARKWAETLAGAPIDVTPVDEEEDGASGSNPF